MAVLNEATQNHKITCNPAKIQIPQQNRVQSLPLHQPAQQYIILYYTKMSFFSNLKECNPRCVYQNYSRSMIKE